MVIPPADKTKNELQAFWRKMRADADERWAIGLRTTANIVGYCLSPVGWSWDEYRLDVNSEPMPYEDPAGKVRRLGVPLETEPTPEGIRAAENGAAFRRAMVEKRIMRMIVRQEIPVILRDDRAQGWPISDKTRLYPGLVIDVEGNGIDLDEIVRGHGWSFETDANAVFETLDGSRYWQTKASINYLVVERHLRDRFETEGLPDTRDNYAREAALWYSVRDKTKKQPNVTETRQLVSRLFDEYADSEN